VAPPSQGANTLEACSLLPFSRFRFFLFNYPIDLNKNSNLMASALLRHSQCYYQSPDIPYSMAHDIQALVQSDFYSS